MHDDPRDTDKAAFEAAVDQDFELMVKLVAAELELQWDDACHWVETAIVNAWQAIVRGTTPHPVECWRSYLVAAATRMAKRALGRQAPRPQEVSLEFLMDEHGFDAAAPAPDDEAQDPDERLGEIHGSIAALPPRERAAVELFYFSGLSHLEIAERLGITPRSSQVLLSRALARLRCFLIDSHDAA